MNKDKKRTVKPEGKIKHMLRTNYWLTPLLLVALVFAVVFGISKIPHLSQTIQGWFNKHEECKQCTNVSYDEFKDQISTADGTIFVLFTENNSDAGKKLFPVLDKYLDTNKVSKDIKIITVDVSMNDDKFTFVDSTLDSDKLNQIKDEFNSLGEGVFSAPSIVRYEGGKMKQAISGYQDYNTIKDFFEEK